MQTYDAGQFDVVVVGAGHAGCEAGLAAARLGKKVLVLAISLDSVADLPCNPNIGGTGKGHLVREIDALGGEMARIIDKTFIQSRMLNTSKGPAVHSLRVQADKRLYHSEMKKVLEEEPGLMLVEGEVSDLLVEEEGGKKAVTGVILRTGALYRAKAVIICSGTYLRGEILMGELRYASGPHGMKEARFLSQKLEHMGIELMRFKTGTPARVLRSSIDFSGMEVQEGDDEVIPFSFENFGKKLNRPSIPCHLTWTTPETEALINQNLHRSPMYSGQQVGRGPRYCPSIEDKIVRFPDRPGHQVFIEPEGLDTQEMYVQGMSSTLPEEVQKEVYKTIPGLENVIFMRSAYGIEYDVINATDLALTLEHMAYSGLYFAGQINGSSGYEEAAAQGLMAGINSVLKMDGKDPFILNRSEAYIGVLIDDLVTKGTDEPYRMMTSRAEYRLTLRQDNADLRLTEKGHALGLASDERLARMRTRKEALEGQIKRLKAVILTPNAETNALLESLGSVPLKTAASLYDLLKRPELTWESTLIFDPERSKLPKSLSFLIETEVKYEGYIQRQNAQIERFRKLEEKSLAEIEDYGKISGLKIEAVQKLNKIRPASVGQASRISGVSPGDVNVLLIHLEMLRREKAHGTK